MKKIIIAGGAGYLGRALAKHFTAQSYEVVTLARSSFSPLAKERFVKWDGETLGAWGTELEGAVALINLAGRTVNCRYNEKNRAEILNSRVNSTRVLGEAVAKCKVAPSVWMNSSTATIYRNALDRDQTESTGEIGKGFSVEIAKAWETEFFKQGQAGVRQVALRSAMVFGNGAGGVYEAFRDIAKQGLGGRAGDGKQYVSWIHLDDFVLMIQWILDRPEISGAVNIASPDPRPNKEFMRLLRRSLGIKFGLSAPEWLLEVGAVFKRTETELLLKSRRVVPERMLDSGYKMKFSKLEAALENLANYSTGAS